MEGLKLAPESTFLDVVYYYAYMNKGLFILIAIMTIEWPKSFIDQIFHKLLDQFLGSIREAQRTMIYNKYCRVSNATNKTVSTGKFHHIFWGAINSHWGFFWMGAEIIKAFIVLLICSKALYDRIGWAYLILPASIISKIIFDKYTRKWRERSWRRQHKVGDKRRNELESAFNNIKTVKLYAW